MGLIPKYEPVAGRVESLSRSDPTWYASYFGMREADGRMAIIVV